MKIAALEKEFKTEDVIHLDELVNMVGESLYDKDWQENPYTQVEPFYRITPKEETPISTEAMIHSLIVKNHEPKFFNKTISFSHDHIALVHNALEMLMTIRQRLWVMFCCAEIPYNVLLKDGNIMESDDINGGMWLTRPNTIFCTGYFPVKKGGIRKWGRLLFKKEQALKSIKTINKDTTISPELIISSTCADDSEGNKTNKKLDPRITNSLLRIILAFSIRHHSSQMMKGNSHGIGDSISGLAGRYGIQIDSKNVADKIDMAKQLPEWDAYVEEQKKSPKLQ